MKQTVRTDRSLRSRPVLTAQGSPALRADVEGVLKEMEGFVGRTPAEIWEGMKR